MYRLNLYILLTMFAHEHGRPPEATKNRQGDNKMVPQIRKDTDIEPVAYHVSSKTLLEDYLFVILIGGDVVCLEQESDTVKPQNTKLNTTCGFTA